MVFISTEKRKNYMDNLLFLSVIRCHCFRYESIWEHYYCDVLGLHLKNSYTITAHVCFEGCSKQFSFSLSLNLKWSTLSPQLRPRKLIMYIQQKTLTCISGVEITNICSNQHKKIIFHSIYDLSYEYYAAYEKYIKNKVINKNNPIILYFLLSQ